MKKVIGLTGGIASGKSTVGKMFSELGVTVIDADQLSREVTAPGGAGNAAIIAKFGSEYAQEDGSLNRVKLGALVFGDPKAMVELNAISHPLIAKLSAERIEAAKEGPTPYVIYDAALHVELGTYKSMDKLVVVATSVDLQTSRLMKRNKLTESEARDRLAAQYPLPRKLAVADYVLYNDNDKEALYKRVLRIHEELLSL